MFERGRVDAAALAALVNGPPRVPKVYVRGIMPDSPTDAAMLAWGRHERLWLAGVSWLYSQFRGAPRRAVLTLWVAWDRVTPVKTEYYGEVPRVRLVGGPEQWPQLPARYLGPEAGAVWRAWPHVHATRPDPHGLYDVPVAGSGNAPSSGR